MNIINSDEKNLMFQKIMDNFPSMIGYWDKDLKNKFSNAAYKDFFQKDSHEIYGKHISEIIGLETFNKNIEFIKRVLNGEEQFFERELTKNGETRYTQAIYIPDIENNIVLGFYVLVNDITQLKNMEKEKNDIYKKLIQSSKMIALGEMASGIAHEINNPLSIIRMNARFIEESLRSEKFNKAKAEKNIDTIISTSDRIEKIITGLQYFSQDRPMDPFSLTSVTSIIDETLMFCLQRLKSKNIHFTQSYVDPNLFIECSSIQISQVLLNLLNNAIDAVETSLNKWISLKTESISGQVIISISDSGPVIDPSIKDKLMQPFMTTKAVGKGTGLGLSISKGIIERHMGTIDFDDSALNTTIKITLKLANIIS